MEMRMNALEDRMTAFTAAAADVIDKLTAMENRQRMRNYRAEPPEQGPDLSVLQHREGRMKGWK